MHARIPVDELRQEATEVSLVELPALLELPTDGSPLFGGRLDLVDGLKLRIQALGGESEVSVRSCSA